MARSHQDGPYYLSVNTLIQPMQERKTKVRKATCRSETNELPRFFIKFLTDPGDLVLDPFAGSNSTGSVAQELDRRWIAMEKSLDYVVDSKLRFLNEQLRLFTSAPTNLSTRQYVGVPPKAGRSGKWALSFF